MKDNKDFNIPQSLIDAVKKVVETDTVQEAKDPKEYGYEGDMAISQLKTIVRHAEHLMGMLKPETDLPEWVQSKLTLAQDYIRTSHDYLMSETNESLHPNQKKLDVAKPKGKLTAADFAALRAGKKTQKEEVEQVDELSRGTLRRYYEKAAQSADYHKKQMNRLDRDDDALPVGSVQAHKDNRKARKYHDSQNFKRRVGMGKAIDRAFKEEVEQVDEAKLFHPGQEVTVHKVDQYGFQGRDHHPPSSGVDGHKVRITHYADTDRDRLGGKHGVEGDPGYRYQVVHGTMKSGPHKGKSFQFINHELKHSAKTNEEVERVDERTLTPAETKKKEEIVKSMKKGTAGFKKRYGERWKEVMYATSTKLAKKD